MAVWESFCRGGDLSGGAGASQAHRLLAPARAGGRSADAGGVLAGSGPDGTGIRPRGSGGAGPGRDRGGAGAHCPKHAAGHCLLFWRFRSVGKKAAGGFSTAGKWRMIGDAVSTGQGFQPVGAVTGPSAAGQDSCPGRRGPAPWYHLYPPIERGLPVPESIPAPLSPFPCWERASPSIPPVRTPCSATHFIGTEPLSAWVLFWRCSTACTGANGILASPGTT